MVSDSIIINSMFDFKHKKLPQPTFSFFYAFRPKVVFYPQAQACILQHFDESKKDGSKPVPDMSNNFLQPSAAQRMLHPFLEQRSIAFANAAAAITVSRRGALTSIPTEAEVTALISGTDNG